MSARTILHLCADIGSDSYPYQCDPNYDVIMVGKDIGVENYKPDRPIHGVIANPVCREFSAVVGFHNMAKEPDLTVVQACQRIIEEANPKWWVIENPYNGNMKKHSAHPWQATSRGSTVAPGRSEPRYGVSSGCRCLSIPSGFRCQTRSKVCGCAVVESSLPLRTSTNLQSATYQSSLRS